MDAYLLRGISRASQGDPAEALFDFSHALRPRLDAHLVYYNRTFVHWEQGDRVQALEDARVASELRPAADACRKPIQRLEQELQSRQEPAP